MPDKGTSKKVTRVEGGDSPEPSKRVFTPTPESKGKAGTFRLIAVIAWVLAIGAEVGAIFLLQQKPVSMVWMIVAIVVDLAFAITGSLLWKKANRFDPASKQDKIRFFVQNQLGLIIAIVAFLPLVVLIFTNKNLDAKQKGILGAVAGVALLVAGYFGIDFNPPSQEEYAAQTQEVTELTGSNFVYWTKFGTKFHIYSDCQHINTSATEGILEGTVAQARELKNITELCDTRRKRAEKDKAAGLAAPTIPNP